MTRDQTCGFPPRARKYRRSASVTTSDFFRISFRQTSASASSISAGTVTEMALYLAEIFMGLVGNSSQSYCIGLSGRRLSELALSREMEPRLPAHRLAANLPAAAGHQWSRSRALLRP